MENPYRDLLPNRYWKTGVATCSPLRHEDLFTPKWSLDRKVKIATAGSCFAQHISSTLRANGFNVLDYEPAPEDLPAEKRKASGYDLFSCRYGNIYTSRQFVQLARECFGLTNLFVDTNAIWVREGRYYDALRPTIPSGGYLTKQEVIDERNKHLQAVKLMLLECDLLIFTLGLTETWIDGVSNVAYPTAPGVISQPERDSVDFCNLGYKEIYSDLEELSCLLAEKRQAPLKFLLTVSPVPLTATSGGTHVLLANTYSKAVLRAVSGDMANSFENFDYFPSYEIVTNPASRSSLYEDNLRSVTSNGVDCVMDHFLSSYGIKGISTNSDSREETQCDEALLEVFAPSTTNNSPPNEDCCSFGDSHLAAFFKSYENFYNETKIENVRGGIFVPLNWMEQSPYNLDEHKFFTEASMKEGYESHTKRFKGNTPSSSKKTLCLVGLDLMGNAIVNAHGPMKPGWTNPDGSYPPGSQISPTIPIVASSKEAEEIIGQQFRAGLEFKRKFLEHLFERKIWDEIYWIATPMMCERVARYRLGDIFVNSGSQQFYNEMAQRLFDDVFSQLDDSISILMQNQLSESGFTSDRFLPGPLLFDTHVSSDYFGETVAKIFKI